MNLKKLFYLPALLLLIISCKKDNDQKNHLDGYLKKITHNQDATVFSYNEDGTVKAIDIEFSDIAIARIENKYSDGKRVEWIAYDSNGYLSPIRKASTGTFHYTGKLIKTATRIIYPNFVDVNTLIDEFTYDDSNFLKGYSVKSGIGINPTSMQLYLNVNCETDENGNIIRTTTNSYLNGQLNEVIEYSYVYDDKINVRKGLEAPVEALDFFNKNNWTKRSTSINGELVTIETRQYTYNSLGKPVQFISKYNGENPVTFNFEYF